MIGSSALRKLHKLSRLIWSPTYRKGLKRGIGAAIEHEGAMRSIAIATLIDVGANVGQFSLLVRATHPNAEIRAFEPLAAMAEAFAALFRDDPAVKLHRVAAGDLPGAVEINVSGRPDSSSLLPISARQNEIFPGTAKASVETVEVVRIDDCIAAEELAKPILVKLDVQGFELQALRGMPKLLSDAQYVYAEVSFLELYEGQALAHELIAWLAGSGFRIAGVYNVTFTQAGAAVQADMLFMRS